MVNKTRRPPGKTQRPGETQRRSLTAQIMELPRYGRMTIVFLSVLVMGFALWQVVGELYLRFFADGGASTTVTWIVTGACLAMYAVGYFYIVGPMDSRPQAGRPQTIYLLVTLLLFIVSVIWVISRTVEALAE